MAAAASSPLASSVEKTNGAKLSRLLIDGGTTVLRNVFDRYHPPANLAADLNANYHTLNTLRTKRVLHKPQWDLLFPPSGATPDSKTFDITLLFLLLTNICGLSPPLSGWHKSPPSSDTSLEANLTRVKLYRNKLYGHVTSTGVQTAVFNVEWQEISAVLVALGLNPVEVVRLKTEPCGEDYISAEIEWVRSDEEIKSQLGDVRKSQKEARQMQEEDHKTLQDTHKVVKKVLETQREANQMQHEDHSTVQDTQQAVEDLRRINRDTQQVVKQVLKSQHEVHQKQQETVEQARQAQLEDRKILQDSKSKLYKVYRTQTKTQETVEKVRQTQLEDRETFQNSKSKLDKVHQTQLEDRETLQDHKSKLDKVRKTQSKTQETVEKVRQTQLEDSETLLKSVEEVKKCIDSLKEGRDEDKSEEVLMNLAKSEFKGDIEYLAGRYQQGTREWVFNEVENWLDDRNSENRVMVISSNAGMGKSVISAVICKRMQEAGRLSGSHFCQHNNARYRNPQLMLQSLACHLCQALPEYKQALVKQLSRNLGNDLNNMGVEEVFALLFKEPLSTVADPGRNMLMVIDGLDESDYQERNKLLDVLSNHLSKLPCWIRFLCTTRPERNISDALKHLKPFELESNDDKNMEDVKRFIENRTQQLIAPEKRGAIVEKLVEKSEGLMLYAYFLVLYIKENKSVLDQEDLNDSLPLAISSAYHSYFKRLENELKKELGVNEDNFLNLLSAVIASREPLPIDFVSKLLGPNASSPLARRKVLKAISSVSSLLPIRDGCLHVIHKSVKDWLTDASCYGEHDFTIDEKEGHRILARLCADELDRLKKKHVLRDAQFSSTEKYALHHGVRHMLQLDENMRSRSVEECVQTYVIDLELLYAKLCLHCSTAAEEILWLLSQELSRTLSENSRDLLNALMLLLRKHFNSFTDHPHLVFQTLLNEGGPVLSPMASNMLQKKYPEIPHMEFVNKQMRQGVVLARFQCSSKVACFDVSPQLDYMVCECKDGTIQLWSLRTGVLLWTRPVMVKKCYSVGFRRIRGSPFSSNVFAFYRSVVFHPSEEVVLPGVLSHAYDFNGNLKPLFPESNCSFTVCSISGDKTTMLTDCPDDGKCIIMWSLQNGSEITRTTRDEDVLSFAWSRDVKLLAISHLSGRIAIVDVAGGFRTLGQTDLQRACGMIMFSPDSRSLLCYHSSLNRDSTFRLNINIAEQLTCRVDVLEEPYVAWEFESRSEGGFLLGDPLSSQSVFEKLHTGILPRMDYYFVLEKQTVLRSHHDRVEMLDINEQQENEKEAAHTIVRQIVFSLSGETIYVVINHDVTKVMAWNVSNSELIAEKEIDSHVEILGSSCNRLLAVKGGVLISGGMGTLQMWNFELSKCIRRWTNIGSVTDAIPISEERVACTTEESEVIIFDTTSGEILLTMQIDGTTDLLACNSKFQILTRGEDGFVRLSDRETTLWKKELRSIKFGRISPAGSFVIIRSDLNFLKSEFFVLDAVSGKTLHVLVGRGDLPLIYECEFVSDEECVVVTFKALSEQCCVELFNVKSGDLLSNLLFSDLQLRNRLGSMYCLAASPCKRLVAIYLSDSKHGYELIQVRLPGDEDSRKSKR